MRAIEFHPADASRLSYIASASRRGPSAAAEIQTVVAGLADPRARRVADAIAERQRVYRPARRASPEIASIALGLLVFAGVVAAAELVSRRTRRRRVAARRS